MGSTGESGFTNGAGAAHAFRFDGNQWQHDGKLSASDGLNGDAFGSDVAVHGDRVIIGAAGVDDGLGESGAAYVFSRLPAGWLETHKCRPSDPTTDSGFGDAVALGNGRALCGAQGDDDGAPGAGSFYSYLATPNQGFVSYGAGCPGSGGFTPMLSMKGCPIGGGFGTLEVTEALGGSSAVVLFGAVETSTPIAQGNCALLISPISPVAIVLPLFGSGPGNGFISITGNLPASVVGEFTLQVFAADPTYTIGFVTTNGVKVIVQP